MIASRMAAAGERDPRAARRQLLDDVDEFVEVHGAHKPALLPPTWSPVRVPAPPRGHDDRNHPLRGVP